MMTDTDAEQGVTLVLSDKSEVSCSTKLLRQSSAYFAAILDGNFAESQSRRIELFQLDLEAVKAILEILQNQDTDVLEIWEAEFLSVDTQLLEEALDYLQIGQLGNSPKTTSIVEVVRILNLSSSFYGECEKNGWINSSGGCTRLPEGKKRRKWRFWVLLLLCIDIMEVVGDRVDQATFTKRLGNLGDGNGGAVALRRELIEYGLIEREDDGSAYWRPAYTIQKMRSWTGEIPRLRVI